MKGIKNIFLYIFCLALMGLASACTDDVITGGSDSEGGPVSGTLALNISAGNAGLSTRSLNMNDGATVKINSLWVGVFDRKTGQRLGRTRIDGFDKTLTAGIPSRNLVTVDFYSDYSNPEVFVVGMANFEDVVTWNKTPIIEAVEAAASWYDLVELDVDAASAYAGDKGEMSLSQSPFLMGYYLESTGMTRIPKFNQFDNSDAQLVPIYPENASKALTIKLNTNEQGQMFVPAGALALRRFVTNVNVNLKPGPGVEISDVAYQVFNRPEVVYFVQRRTDTETGRSFADWQKNSPNRADCFLTEAGEFAGAPVYTSDTEWNTDLAIDGLSFSFQHFENKHWGESGATSFSQREAKNTDGTLKALSPNGSRPYNTYASYFRIKMHVSDSNRGKNGDVIYTVHEGLCNDDDGRRAETDDVKLRDFGAFRNVNYTYTINVNGMENIVVNSSMEEEDDSHFYGQEGTVWNIIYANGNDARRIPEDGGTYGQVKFEASAIPAFRIYGYGNDGKLYDFCFNFPSNGSQFLGGFWPEGSATTVFSNDIADLKKLPANLLSQMRITDGSTDYSPEEFLANTDFSKTYSFKFSNFRGAWEDDPRENMRALYLFDKNELREDFDGCSTYGKVYVAEQYPYDDRPTVSFNTSSVVGHTALHETSENKWCGTTNSKIEMLWTHDDAFEGYFVEVEGRRDKISKEMLAKLIQDIKGKKTVVYPFISDRLAASESAYKVTITPIPVDKSYKGAPTVVSNMLYAYPSKWDAKNTALWKDLNLSGKTKFDVEYRGLEMMQDHATANASVKGSYWSFGGSTNTTTRVMRFYTVKSGKMTVKCCSNAGKPSGAANGSIDTSRYVMATMFKYDDAGNQIELNTISLEDQHVTYSDTYCDRVFDITISEPCYVALTMSGGNIRVQTIDFAAY